MIDRKLLKTNRWFDEEFLQAKMTNACFNGGGGGDNGGDDFFGDDDDVSGGYEFGDRGDGGQAERDAMAAQIDRQMQAQEIERQMAAQETARQEAARVAQQQAHDQHVAAQAAQQAAAAQAQAERQRANEFASAQAAQQEAAARQRANEFASAQQAQQDAAAAAQVDNFSNIGVNVDTFGGMQDAIARQNVDTFGGTQDVLGSAAGLSSARQAQENAAAMRDIAADDYMGGFLDPTRSPAVDDFSTISRQVGGGGWTSQGALDQARIDAQATAAGLDPVNQEGYFDRFGRWVSGIFGMPKDVQYQVDTFREINPDGTVTHADGRITDASGQIISGPTRTWHEPWYADPNRDRGGRREDRDDSWLNDPRYPERRGGPPGEGGEHPGWVSPGFPSDGGGWRPGGGGEMWPPGGGGGWPPGGGYGGGMGGGMGGGFPPTYGAGRRTGGGMPGYMANYPIHSQNLFNFTPARAMPGIDPSYQPWMQPAQGMAENLWNYQAPNLLPWDMTNRVPWNFATTPTGQYGPMVATVGGQPADGGDRGNV